LQLVLSGGVRRRGADQEDDREESFAHGASQKT
jgi:hypothetical protein